MKKIVGGGPKKVLYTLNTVRRIGVKRSGKALMAKNACKACAFGMGGQRGGMTNELDEFPSVCNKSVQAQSTDIQPPIPKEVFEHSLEELRALSAHELEHLGRLDSPIYKAADSNRFKSVDWDWALRFAASQFSDCSPERSFFYSSGRSSNESGFLLQLLARLYGTNNVNNCSYYCHQATSVGLSSSIGTGTATVELADLTQCDLIFVVGANPASNHPRFIHQLKSCRDRGGHVVVINPAKEAGLVKFAVPKSPRSMISGGTEIASLYLQPNIGGDLALLKGLAKAVIELGAVELNYITQYCEDYERFKEDIEATEWSDIETACAVSRERLIEAARLYNQSKNCVFAWGMGITQHQFGSENVEYIVNLALLRGMIGRRFSGLLPLRGHSNVQGIGTIGVKPVLPEAVFKRMETRLNIQLPRTEGWDTYRSLQAAYEHAVDCACIVGGNLYSASPDSIWVREALNRIGFKLFLTTTLNQGHLQGVDDGEVLILPVAARDEEQQSTTQESMFNYIRLSDGGEVRLKGARSEVTILADIGKQLLPDSPLDFDEFKNHSTIRETIANTIPGLEQLQDLDVAKQEFHIRNRLLHAPTFNTPSGKARFTIHPIPTTDRSRERYPFMLATVRSEGQFNSIIYEEQDSYRHDAGRMTLFMSPEDMQRLMLSNGDEVSIYSSHGELSGLIIQSYDLPAGNLLGYYPECNALTERKLDPRSRTPNFKSVPVKVKTAVRKAQ